VRPAKSVLSSAISATGLANGKQLGDSKDAHQVILAKETETMSVYKKWELLE